MSDSIFSPRPAPGHLRATAMPRASTASPAPRTAAAVVPDLPPARTRAAIGPDVPVASIVPDLPPLHAPTATAASSDAALLRILHAPLAYGMTAREGFMRKEAELRAAFAALPVATQRALHARLSNPHAGDELATKFHQLTAERRTRLLNFLADARRREALAAAR